MTNIERWLYQENTFSQQMLMLFLAGNTVFTIFFANNADVDLELGIFILLNIIISMISFLVAVRQKIYDRNWGYIGLGLAVIQWVRLVWMPEELVDPMRMWLYILLIATGALALVGSLVCLKRTQERDNYIAEHNINLATLQK